VERRTVEVLVVRHALIRAVLVCTAARVLGTWAVNNADTSLCGSVSGNEMPNPGV
jgi:hypothetical protein